MSAFRTPSKTGTTRAESTDFASAPASKSIQGAFRFSEVKQTMPKLVSLRRNDICSFHRWPASMSRSDIQGLARCTTALSQSCKRIANDLLRAPDHEMKIFTQPNLLEAYCTLLWRYCSK